MFEYKKELIVTNEHLPWKSPTVPENLSGKDLKHFSTKRYFQGGASLNQ